MVKRNSTTSKTRITPTTGAALAAGASGSGRSVLRRRPVRRPFTSAAALALALTVAGCGSENERGDADQSATDNENIQLGLSLPDAEMEFFQQILAGAREEAKVQDVPLSVRDAKTDAKRQSQDLRKFTEQGVSSVVVAPVSSALPADALRRVSKAGIPVVAADRVQANTDAVTLVSSDNEPGGRLGADALASALGGKGTIAVLRGPANTTTAKDRGKGFRAGMKEHKNIKIAASEEADFDREKAEKVMGELIANNPSITGVFAENDDMARGAAEALESWPGMDVKIVGFDGTTSGLKAVKDGTFAATVAQQPEEIGKLAVRNAIRAAKGEAVDDRILVPLRVANKTNINEFP